MNKNNIFSDRRDEKRQFHEVHPVWRGIGLILIVFIPILSYFASGIVLQLNAQYNWLAVPPELIIRWQDPMILAKLFLTVMISFFVFALFQLITFVLNAVFGPPRYIPPDIPPLRKRSSKNRLF